MVKRSSVTLVKSSQLRNYVLPIKALKHQNVYTQRTSHALRSVHLGENVYYNNQKFPFVAFSLT